MIGLRVLSLGAGVQSTALALLAVDGHLPAADVAIFADTSWEPAAVYTHLDRLTPVLETAGIEVCRVTAGDIRSDALDAERRFASMPLYFTGPDGSRGLGQRQCTSEYKLAPILAEIRRRLGAPELPGGRVGRTPKGRRAEVAIGISHDEIERARTSRANYVTNTHPLLTGFDRPWTRQTCQRWLTDRWPHPVPRSACVGCPFRTDTEWLALTETEFTDAVDFDRSIRPVMSARGFHGQAFLHQQRVPLDQVDLNPTPKPSTRPCSTSPRAAPGDATATSPRRPSNDPTRPSPAPPYPRMAQTRRGRHRRPPHEVGESVHHRRCHRSQPDRPTGPDIEQRAVVTNMFNDWLTQGTDSPWWFTDGADQWHWIHDHLGELARRMLACWCPLNQPCHAEVLARLARTTEVSP